MNLISVIFLCLFAFCSAKDCSNVKRTNSKLICYYSQLSNIDHCYCTHVILPANTDVILIENLKRKLPGVKILLTVNEFNEGLVTTVKQNHIDGLELNLKKLSTKDDISEFINTVRTKLGNDLFLALSIPPKTELLAKYYDLKTLTKSTDLFILQTAFLGASKNVTFHPSRLSGLWDMQNTDSVVDLITGLGAPLSRLVVTSPVQAFQFTLQDESLTTPGSPALQLKTITRKELCERMNNEDGGSWTLERDQDQAGPYIFRGKEWIAFEDSTSMDIKAKYARIRGLAGLALKDLSQDIHQPLSPTVSTNSNENKEAICESILLAAHSGLSRQTRAPRQAVLRSLEREILETPAGPLSTVHVSPYRITRIVDVEGHVHSVRKDTRTEFECSRQGYFVHPHSCGRFYRCVKFDQLTDEFSVFEFDCPAGLVFDERVEVCVWPGNLPDGKACHGSSEIAPVPKNRFDCPSEPGYYVDPENCRWFFACLDHGKSGLTAYEFRCPFGLVFDEKRLLCEWPWLVPTCGSGYIAGLELDHIEFYGGAAKSTITTSSGSKYVTANIQPQLHVVSSGAQILDGYDGLGSLGAVTLGGYNGDLTLLKQNLNLNAGYYAGNLAHISASNEANGQLLLNAGHSYGIGSQNAELNVNDEQLQLNNFGVGQNSGEYIDGALLNSANVGGSKQYYTQSSEALLNSGLNTQFNNNNDGESNIVHFGSAYNVDNSGKQAVSSVEFNKNAAALLTNNGNYEQQAILLNGDHDKNAKLVENYQTVQHAVPIIQKTEIPAQKVVELQGQTHSGTLNYNYQFANEAEYKTQPVVSQTNVGVFDKYNVATSINNANKVTHNIGESLLSALPVEKPDSNLSIINYASNYVAVTPKTDIFTTIGNGKQTGYSSTYQYQSPAISKIKTVVPLQEVKQSDYSSSYHHQSSNLNFKQNVQPVITEYKTPIVQETVVPVQQSGYSSSYHHQSSNLNLEQNVQPVITEYKTPVVQETIVPVQEVQKSGYSSSYHHQSSNLNLEQKVQPIITEYKTPVIQETVLPISDVKQTVYSSSYHHQHHEQKLQPLVTEIKTPIIQQQVSVTVPEIKQTYQYETPVVQYEHKVQPVITEVKAPVKQTSYSSTYHYQTPVVQYEQKVQPVVTEIKAPVIQKQTILSVPEVKQTSYHYQTPVVQLEQKVQPVVTEIKTPIVQQQHSYSSSYHYQAPAVKLEQKVQPVITEYKTPVIQQEAVKQTGYSSSYHYQAPAVQLEQKVQPVITEYKTPVVQQAPQIKQTGYSSSYHYQAPVVQLEQKVQPVITEYKTPVVQQHILPAPEIKQSGYSSSYHYQAPTVQLEQKIQPIITEYKTPIIKQEAVKQTGYSSSYHYQAPAVKLEQKQQPVITEYKTPVIQQHSIVPVSQVKQTGYSSSYHYQAPAVQLEQKVQPAITEYKTPVVQQHILQAPEIKQTGYSSSYHYQAPAVQLEQKVQPVITEYKAPIIKQETVKQTGYSSSYHYQAPAVQLKQEVQPIVTEYKTPLIQKQTILSAPEVKQTGYSSSYHYQAPVVHYEQKVQPVVTEIKAPVTEVKQSYQYQTPVIQYEQKVQPVVTEYKTPVIQKQSGYSSSYHYQAPAVKYEQKVQPVITEYKIPEVQKTYQYQTPVVQYEQKQAKSHSQFYGVQHNIEVKQPEITLTKYETPIQTVTVTPKYETHQYYDKRIHEVKVPVLQEPTQFVSATPKYETQFYGTKIEQKLEPISYEGKTPVVEETIVPVKTYQTYSSPVKTTYKAKEYLPPKPTIHYVSSTPKAPEVYVSTTPKYAVFQEYIQPKQTFEIRKKVTPTVLSVTPTYETYSIHAKQQPAIVEQYSYVAPQPEIKQEVIYTTSKPKAYLPPKAPQIYISSTPKYDVIQEYVKPKQIVEVKKQPSPTVISQYEYVNPDYANYESQLNLNLDQFNYQPTNAPIEQYHTQTAFYSTLKPEPVKNYQTDYIISTPKPTFISTIAPVIKLTPTVRTKVVAINKYQTYDDKLYVSTPKQFYVSTPAPVIKTVQSTEQLPPFRYYDSRYDTATKKAETAQYLKETSDYSAELYDQYDNYQPEYIVSTETPKIVSTVRPIVQRKKIASTTTPVPLEIYDEYSNENFDSQYIVQAKPTIATTFRPEIKKYVVSTTTAAPQDTYYEEIQTTARPVLRKKIVTTTLQPIVKKKKIVVTTTTSAPLETVYDYDEYYVSSEKPKYESVKITPRPKAKGKTVVRVNDFHPFLTTKLGAQCTCISNAVKLRKGSKEKTIVEDYTYELPENVPVTKLTSNGPAAYDDYNEPGVYVVGNSEADEDYDYELKKVAVTKTPDVIIKSTTNAVQPAPTPLYTIRKKVTTSRPNIEVTSSRYRSRTSTTSRIEEIFLKNNDDTTEYKISKSKERKIVEALNEGLSLVKSAVKSAVKEAINEESRNFDRYGPGGWRSRDETLQGSVDCKREGLFRHPTQCNKFYACRWDCTKQRYTLHVFNCPVHLTFDTSQGACNWPSKGPACTGNTLLPSA